MKTVLNVSGMTCGNCVKHVSQALRLPGVSHVEVTLGDGSAVIEHDASTPMASLIEAVRAEGYEARAAT